LFAHKPRQRFAGPLADGGTVDRGPPQHCRQVDGKRYEDETEHEAQLSRKRALPPQTFEVKAVDEIGRGQRLTPQAVEKSEGRADRYPEARLDSELLQPSAGTINQSS
jgi:hypothetical protein